MIAVTIGAIPAADFRRVVSLEHHIPYPECLRIGQGARFQFGFNFVPLGAIKSCVFAHNFTGRILD